MDPRPYRNSTMLFRTVPSPIPYGRLFPNIGVLQPQSKISIAIISGTGKATDFKFGSYIHMVHPNRNPLKIWTKGSVGVSRNYTIFKSIPYYLRNG